MRAIELEKTFNPKSFEETIYKKWRENDAFAPRGFATPHSEAAKSAPKPYTIVIPPPNVTGILHMGHALNISLQDIAIRFQRMRGRPALWVPGTDHAGIATQNVVEKRLRARGSSRRELGREAFVEETWKVKDEHHAIITHQIEKMGASVDWNHERFTMDEGLSRAVREVFVTLYERGLIYKGEYLVNWCSRCGTALADDEVEHEDTPGTMYHIRYPLSGGSLEIATTRPETLLGDTAVAVHPDDERYRHLVGKMAELPLTGRQIPVIADSYVDKDFGTGVVKITPAHDPNDWEVGKRHNLPVINILTPEGALNGTVPEAFRGLSVQNARKAVLEALKEGGFYIKETDITHAVGHCYRCRTVIEPYLSEQWFVKMKPLAKKALAAWRRGDIVFYPRKWENTYEHWLTTIRDWCISRQLWWGHRIPAWSCKNCGHTEVSRTDISACPLCGGDVKQDEDVLDTWFSSWLWPFSTLGWPDAVEADAQKILQGEPLVKLQSADMPINGKIRDTALEWIKKHPAGMLKTAIGSVQVSNNSIKDTFSPPHNVYPNKLFVIPALTTLLTKGAYLGNLADLRGNGEVNHYFAAPVELDGKRKIVFLRVKNKTNNGINQFYAHEVYDEEEIKKSGSLLTAPTLAGSDIGSLTDTYRSMLNKIMFVKHSLTSPTAYSCFYPTSALITAYDIIFFWVSRMIMAGLEFTGKAPFRDVYIHGLVRDKQGRKMSKTLGNGIDPLLLIEEYGADALKFTLAFMCAQGQDILIDKESFKLGSKFANKIWNASRYILMNLEGRALVKNPKLTIYDTWIYSRLARAAGVMTSAFENYRYNEAALCAYEYFWNDFCDWYVEASKLSTKGQRGADGEHQTEKDAEAEKDRAVTVLLDVLAESLKLLHPLLPFVTEEIYGYLAEREQGTEDRASSSLLITSCYPSCDSFPIDDALENQFAFLQEIIRSIRTIRSECTVPPEKKIKVDIIIEQNDNFSFTKENTPLITSLAHVSELSFFSVSAPLPAARSKAIASAGNGYELFVYIADAVDMKLLTSKWEKELLRDKKFIAGLELKLKNNDFISRAPPELVEAEREKLNAAKERTAKLEGYIKNL